MKFIIKHSQTTKPQKRNVVSQLPTQNIEKKEEIVIDNTKIAREEEIQKKPKKENNNKKDKTKVMDKISMAEAIIDTTPVKEVKILKKDKGLIERTESSKTILTEDNKQLLVD